MSGTGQSESPVPAREQLDQQQVDDKAQVQGLKEQARDQEQAQRSQLSGGKAKGAARQAATRDKKLARQGNMAALRDGKQGVGPNRGRVDNMTRRDDTDVDEGHFCLIDYGNFPAAKKAVQDQLAPKGSALAGQDFEPGVGSADYGVYLQPGSLGEDGYPETAVVMLRDEHAAQVVVPYEALKPAQAGRR